MKKMFNSIILKKEEYCVVDLEREYPNPIGKCRYVIISEHSRDYLLTNYIDEIREYEPFELADMSYLDFIKSEYARTRAEEYKNSEYMAPYSVGEATDFASVFENAINSVEEIVEKEEEYEELRQAIAALENPVVRERIYKIYWQDKTQEQIANEENVKQPSVNQSLKLALKKIQKTLLQAL